MSKNTLEIMMILLLFIYSFSTLINWLSEYKQDVREV